MLINLGLFSVSVSVLFQVDLPLNVTTLVLAKNAEVLLFTDSATYL